VEPFFKRRAHGTRQLSLVRSDEHVRSALLGSQSRRRTRQSLHYSERNSGQRQCSMSCRSCLRCRTEDEEGRATFVSILSFVQSKIHRSCTIMCTFAVIYWLSLSACVDELAARSCVSDADCLQDSIGGYCSSSPRSASRWCAFASGKCPGG